MLETVGARPGARMGTGVTLCTEDGECCGWRGQDAMGKRDGEGATRWGHGVARGVAPAPPGEAPMGRGGCGEVRGREEGRGREVLAVPGRGRRARGGGTHRLGGMHTGGFGAVSPQNLHRRPWRPWCAAVSACKETDPGGRCPRAAPPPSPVGFTVAIKRLHQAPPCCYMARGGLAGAPTGGRPLLSAVRGIPPPPRP